MLQLQREHNPCCSMWSLLTADASEQRLTMHFVANRCRVNMQILCF